MPKAMVKCPGCGKYFDRESEEFVMLGRRYWHVACASQDDRDLNDLFLYIKQLFGSYDYVPTKKMIDKYHKENGFTYTGIKSTLKYWYEVKGNSKEKANKSIGIVPYVYDEALRYYYDMWVANNSNKPEILKKYEPKIDVIRIKEPEREPMIKRKLFSVLDIEEEDK